jgi:hypothetical protein
MYGSTLRSKCAGIHNPYRRCAFDKCTVFSIEATRNLLDCRVKPDNDKNGVIFQQKLEDNILEMSFPRRRESKNK